MEKIDAIAKGLKEIESKAKDKLLNEAVAIYKKQEETFYNNILKKFQVSETLEPSLNNVRVKLIGHTNTSFRTFSTEFLVECFSFSTKKPDVPHNTTGEASRLLNEMTMMAPNASMNMSLDMSMVDRDTSSIPIYLTNLELRKEDTDGYGSIIANFLAIKDFKIDGFADQVSSEIKSRIAEVSFGKSDSSPIT